MRYIFRSLIFLLFSLASLPGHALFAKPPAPTAVVIQPDPLGRETPRAMVSGLIEALAELDYDRAALYFDIPAVSSNRQRMQAIGQARGFHALLDDGGSLRPFAALSNEAGGSLDDDLPIDQEAIGEITVKGKAVPVLLTRGQDGERQVWRVSKETLSQIAAATGRMTAAQEAEQAAQEKEFVVAGAPLKDWAILVGLGVLVFGGLWMLAALLVAAARRLVADPAANAMYRFVEAALPPLSLLIAVGIFYNWADRLPVAIVARQTLLRYAGIVAVIAVVWFGLRLVDAVAELAITRMQRRGRRQIVSVITLARRTVKVLLLLFSGIGILDTFGIDVTTGIAALGIGGIALALGAQKTVENLVGSVTVIADRPLQVGDFIKVGDVVGTVEDVGIRSTRIRTGERTVVTIPNGDLSARQIENFAARDRFLFNPVIAVDHATPSAKLKEAIAIVQGVLAEHEHIADGARARLGSIGERSFNIDVFAYIDVREFDVQVVIREALLLAIYERLEAAGIDLAFPNQTILLSAGGERAPAELAEELPR
ncbi:mechanosensitive ion channel family protein [Pseudoduganella umbonata]|uniref:Mechanosensitive ion channel family protein n=1 Tax=Pseudoduganella umbonata TaxID=864828 RepID=A0A4P8HQG1_9BURK|nr:mechanosensitive ion channel family protein [Pseudoduganella umbonata]MBB3222703.1 MscS family membrane protein [Pseudoduganella umbonata]QCP10802.1 mechanosensitive ion channel family protein [Pseudoduganella umbonata]